MKSLVEVLLESKGAAIKDRTPDRFPEPKQSGMYLDMLNQKRLEFWGHVEDEIDNNIISLFKNKSTNFINELFQKFEIDLNEDEEFLNITFYYKDLITAIFRFLNDEIKINKMNKSQKNLFYVCGFDIDIYNPMIYFNDKNFNKFIDRSTALKTFNKDMENFNKSIGMPSVKFYISAFSNEKMNSLNFEFAPQLDTFFNDFPNKYRTIECSRKISDIFYNFIKNLFTELRDTLKRAF